MIIRFKHKGLERLFTKGDTRGISAKHAKRLRRIMAHLHASSCPEDMNLPGFGLHPLTGNRKGQWAVSVSGNWRVIFEFASGDATDVDLEDYH
jgi:toxin HigB-1